MRRTIAHEYGLRLKMILPLQAYFRKYVAGSTQLGRGGGEGDFVTLHMMGIIIPMSFTSVLRALILMAGNLYSMIRLKRRSTGKRR